MVRARRLDDAELARREFASEERLLQRRLDRWAEVDPSYDAEGLELDLLAVLEPESVLEIGPGPGELAARLKAQLGASVVAVDLSERLVELVRARGVEAVVGDAQALPFPDGRFHAVVANFVLHFVPDLDAALREIHRVLVPGGAFLAATAHADHLADVWALVDHRFAPSAFGCETGEVALRRHFAEVERYDVRGRVRFRSRHALVGYLDAFALLTDGSLGTRVPESMTAFEASAHGCVLKSGR